MFTSSGIHVLHGPLWRIGWRAVVVAACMGLTLVAACGVSVGDDIVDDAADIDVGQCVTIGASTVDDGNVKATRTDCGGDDLTFYVAAKVPSDAGCVSKNSAGLTFDKGDQKLCMTPSFVAGQCYQVPLPGGRLVDYREVDCDATARTSTIVARTVQRADGEVQCPDDLTTWTFTEPRPIGYCLEALV
ncbi:MULTISPECIES: hypothetical protein [Gordonia]|uniref:hypothetical protein n=1 Tax=Gordonia TaxID=2053 RepID=UPI0007E927B1|nr:MULTISPECIES: hypothetical protein [Gordonia]OBA65254.1 pyridine nucleotide-disulfide oxidoreductase [Gordonia sp. 852002-10350_SCH5691597]